MTDGNAEALKAQQTLKHLLEFLARLENQTEVREKVIEEIRKEVKEYISNGVDDYFAGSNGFLSKTIKQSKKLRSDIVKSDKEQQFDHYKSPFDTDDIHETDYAKHLMNNIFTLFGCLYYMYYECSGECSFIKGAKWKTEKCDGTGGRQHLNKWLTDQKGETSTEHIIKRGFQEGELSTRTGTNVFPPSESSTDALLYYDKGAQLQFALYYMLFLPDDENWNNAQSGHAVLFLEEFCRRVSEGPFKDMYVEKDAGDSFKTACQKVEQNIKTLTRLNIIVPVSWSQTLSYDSLLEVTHFWNYVSWLKNNIEQLIKSLKEMASDVTNWNEAKLISSASYGPYPWGFTFYDGTWNNKSGRLNEPLQNIAKAIQSLQSAIDNIKPIPPSSPASTVGSVIGGVGAAAATAGAAYAGSGFLGPVAESIGRFFRGLFL